ncbi:MAG: hypothetical protein FVQ81_00530 [Candidatus Glassbacteria bacterium]|nr:hypothetical protein [Candidatus Glassbacteria bacterium]
MNDMMTIFLAGVEDIVKNMKELAGAYKGNLPTESSLERKIDSLTERVDKLAELLEGKFDEGRQRGKRMMDIKKRIHNVIKQHPGGIRPPRIAQIIGTRVQNLYPHLKAAVEKKQIVKDTSGAYKPAKPGSARKKK